VAPKRDLKARNHAAKWSKDLHQRTQQCGEDVGVGAQQADAGPGYRHEFMTFHDHVSLPNHFTFFQNSQNIIECDESIHVSVYPCLFFQSDLARTACFVAAWTLREVCYVQRVFRIWRRFLLDGLRSLRYHTMLLRTGKRSSKRGREPAHDRSGNSGYGIAFESRGTTQERPKQVRMVRCYPTFSLTMLLLQANWARCAHYDPQDYPQSVSSLRTPTVPN